MDSEPMPGTGAGSASIVETEPDPTPIVLILAATLRRAEETPKLASMMAKATGNVALKSTVDPQAATIRFQRGRVLVERGVAPDTHVTIATDINRMSELDAPKPKITGAATHLRLALTAGKVLEPPLGPWQAEAARFWSTLASHPRSPAPVPEVWQPRVVVITSANPGEGKSVAVGNIAAALAETGKRVLMIDADLREPELHARFGAPNERGLSDLPAARREIRNMPLEGLVHPTAIKGLYLLPAGPGIVSMASLLHSDRIKALLERCLREFDTVLINAPPMQVPSDAGELARLADGAILVVRHSVTPEPSALAAKKRLVDDGIRIVGTVVSEEEAVPARPAAAPFQSSESILT